MKVNERIRILKPLNAIMIVMLGIALLPTNKVNKEV